MDVLKKAHEIINEGTAVCYHCPAIDFDASIAHGTLTVRDLSLPQ